MRTTSASPTRPQRPGQGGDSPGGEAAGRRSQTVFIRPEDDSSSYESGRESGPATRGDRLNGTNSSKGCHLRRSRCRKRMIRRGAARSARACPAESAPSTPLTYRALRVAHAQVEISKFQVRGGERDSPNPPIGDQMWRASYLWKTSGSSMPPSRTIHIHQSIHPPFR
jgi:hypothetical protein